MVTVQVQIPAGALPGSAPPSPRPAAARAGAGASAAGRGAGLDDPRASPAGAGPRAGRRRRPLPGGVERCVRVEHARTRGPLGSFVCRRDSRGDDVKASVLGVWGPYACTGWACAAAGVRRARNSATAGFRQSLAASSKWTSKSTRNDQRPPPPPDDGAHSRLVAIRSAVARQRVVRRVRQAPVRSGARPPGASTIAGERRRDGGRVLR